MADGPSATGPVRVARGARGAVVAPHHLATAAGLSVLAAGGHAVDAAIATNAVLGVVMPNGCGIGGDAFWLVWDEAASEQVGLNGSGRAARGASARGDARPRPGPDPDARSAGDHRPGRGPLLGPGARALGPPVPRRGAGAGHRARGGRVPGVGRPRRPGSTAPSAALGREPWSEGFRRVWQPNGRTPRPGERVRLEALARTLRTLATEGFDAYYDGDLGERIARGLAAAGSPIDRDDLREQGAEWTTPIATALPRRPGDDPPAEQQRPRRARDPGDPRPLRPAGGCPVRRPRLVRPGLGPPPARGGQARLRGPRRAPRRPGLRRGPRGPAAGRRPRRGARRAHRPRDAPTSPRPPRGCSSAGRSISPWSTATATR